MSEDTELPVGWSKTQLIDVCDITMGQSPPSETYNEDGIGLPFFQGKAEFGDIYPQVRKWCIAASKTAEKGDILLSVRAPVGPTNLAPYRCAIGRGLAAIHPLEAIPERYILYGLRTLKSELIAQATGSTFEAISGDVVRNLTISLPPLAEQRRIVAAIEELFTRLDAGVTALRRAQAALKRYRAAVLKAAVEGRLTADWRAAHPEAEPASAMLGRILAERRAHWEAEQRAKGRDPAKVRYDEPYTPDTARLPALPEGWVWATVEQLSDETRPITYGVIKLGDPVEDGVPTLRSSNVRHLRLSLAGLKSISPEIAAQYGRTFLQGGEVLVTVRGTLGGVVVAPPTCAGYNISREVAMIACTLQACGPCLALFIGSQPVQNWLNGNARGIAYVGINIETLKQAPIPLPPIAEQEQIVAEVERRLSVVSELEATLAATLKRAERLRQAILERAFSGRLVAQEAGDEPASVLLARIEAGREPKGNGLTTTYGSKQEQLQPYPRTLWEGQ